MPILLLSLVGGLAAAQPPAASPDDPPPFIIRPQKPGSVPQKDPPGVIVIRPGGKLPSQKEQPKSKPAAPAVLEPKPPTNKADGEVVFDYWFAAAVEGQQFGYLQWTARDVEKNGKKLRIGVKYQKFTVARFGQVVSQFGEESTIETVDGEVVITSMRQGLGMNQALALTGTVEGKTLKIRGEGAAAGASDTPWPGGVTGIAREPFLFKEKPLKPGESFEYLTYVPQVNRVVKVTVTLEAEESKVLWPGTPARALLRYQSKMEPVANFKLPPAMTWIDAQSFEPLMVEFNFPGLGGRVTFLRTTEEAAKRPVTNPPDLFKVQSIPLDREIPGIHGKGAVVYKVSLPQADEPGTVFPADFRQAIANLDEKAKTLELHLSPSQGPHKSTKPLPEPGKDFLESNFFINWDDANVKAHAAKAVANLPAGATVWDRAKAVEQWVHGNMRAIEFSQAMATADNVAKSLSGDCTEYAMLAAAMCRANGIPSRTALGLVYASGAGGKPFLAYHMWFEVFADGQWLPLDATLGRGGIGPGHVKITDHSWHEEKSLAPLLPVLRVLMARPSFEVLKVSP
jgi:hypothetical protein